MAGLWWDLRIGFRALVRARGFTVVAVGILAIGIGATTTMFSAIEGVLLRPLPYREPERLVAVWESSAAEHIRGGVAPATLLDWRAAAGSLEDLAAFRPWGVVLTGDAVPERILGARVSANLFPLLGVAPLLGRTFRAGEDLLGQPRTVLLSEELWRRRFGAESGLIGRSVRLDGEPAEVVGIVPAGFSLPQAELWVPLSFAPYELEQRGARVLTVIGRLRAGVSLPAAQSELDAIARTLQQRHPESSAGWGATLAPLQRDLVGDTRTTLLLLFGATVAVLVVACANLGNLLLVRGTMRGREIALRAALGAGRARIARQLLAENLVLVLLAGVIGFGLAALGTDLLAGLSPVSLLRGGAVRISGAALGFAVLVSLAVGLVLGLIPVRNLARVDLGIALKSAGAPASPVQRVALRDLLVIGQVAVALFLLVGGGLLVRSLLRAQAVELGFTPGGVAAMTVSLPEPRYRDGGQKAAFFQDLVGRIEALPGVRAVGLASHLPLGTGPLMADFTPSDRAATAPGETPRAQLIAVSSGYFATLGIRLLRGRQFDQGDRAGAPPVVIVDASLARQVWPGADPIGRRIRVGAALGADTALREVVGVVDGVRTLSLERQPEPVIYLPHAQNPWPTMNLVVQAGAPATMLFDLVAAQVRALDPGQPVYNPRALEQTVDRALAYRRFQTTLLGAFALTALLLSVIGVYGVLAFGVAQRTRELGIRVALGATSRGILLSVLGQAVARMGAGLLIGGAGALAAGRVLRGMLYQVSPADPTTFAGAALMLLAAGMIAGYLPARRATRVDPMEALGREG